MDLSNIGLIAGAYLLGAIPFGYLAGRLAGVDVRKAGSGNIGATNVLRTVGRGPAAATLLLDILKGFLPVWLARRPWALPPAWVAAIALAVVAGHVFSPFLKFRGGKGVATAVGVLLGISPPAALAAVAVFGLVFGLGRIVSLASLAAAVLLPFLLGLLAPEPAYAIFGGLVGALVVLRHRANLDRLLSRSEPRTQWKK
ncbi:MAG TPA: glycerol-3-phosphate 1-O-acyltransferase PlsY [bacterium]|uniref:Glycerol-3-phosphate acyltransferase n=1 Tax=candidate division TA06 bacterium ADurb.Bin417 TaxID=1852828 RepID=A0A1V5M945_UNCT6|nr:MAG: Glycerol-3-phosphate acyltransferase [candidate division TA06 bacterium ADurb.Bin417]HNQ34737.1 glycerol-3-phosphate 1-O-acyltransferase PlsY [bacterium]HNS48225.1 glycerol-3-phosphate 1-O-acyltransferase PlsY [bacterium]